jgi:signal transduction histidine kinase/CheY-like chemotaxis protein
MAAARTRLRGPSLFSRLFAAFIASGIIVAAPLIYLSWRAATEGALLRLEQTVAQQLDTIARGFEQEFALGLLRSLRALETAEALSAFHLSPEDERIVTTKGLEGALLRVQQDFPSYSGIYYLDRDGGLVSGVEDGKRGTLAGARAEALAGPGALAGDGRAPFLEVFQKVRTPSVLLSSGNMEWFMPPREVFVEGPFLDERGRLSFIAARATVDPDSGSFGGVLAIRVTLDEFANSVAALRIREHRPANLLDARGNTLLAGLKVEGDAALPPGQALPPDFAATVRLARAEEGLSAHVDLAVVPGRQFARLTYMVPADLIARDARPGLHFLAPPLAIAIVLVGALAYWMSRRISLPVARLAAASSGLARGDAQGRVDVVAGGEIGVLVDAFNDMATRLEASQASRASALGVLRETAQRLGAGRDAQAAEPPADAGAELGEDVRDLRSIERLLKRLLAEREETLRSLEEAKETADSANLAKDDFLATMSHEIRTPLNALIGLTEIMQASPRDAEQARMLATMQSSGAQLMQLINDVLDFSRLQSSRIELDPGPVELAPFLDRTLAMIGGLPGASKLAIATQLAPDLPPRIVVAEARLAQILINLLGNAVKFTPAGRVDLLVSRGTDGPSGPTIRFEVRDTGIGIPREFVGQVFEPFRQARAQRLRPHAGTGLGLSICRRLAQAMEGSLELARTGPEGSSFVLTLPLVACAPAADPAAPVAAEKIEDASPLRILVAEDTAASQLVVRLMLERLGHSVEIVEDGQAAVEAYARGGFDAVFLDLQMPRMDGYEAARAIRASGAAGAAVPLVALTAFSQPAERERAQASGFSQFVSKPVRIGQVEDAIRRLRTTARAA